MRITWSLVAIRSVQLGATYNVLIDTHVFFETDGITQGNLRSMMGMHIALQPHDRQFDAFSFISSVRETGFEQGEEEPHSGKHLQSHASHVARKTWLCH